MATSKQRCENEKRVLQGIAFSHILANPRDSRFKESQVFGRDVGAVLGWDFPSFWNWSVVVINHGKFVTVDLVVCCSNSNGISIHILVSEVVQEEHILAHVANHFDGGRTTHSLDIEIPLHVANNECLTLFQVSLNRATFFLVLQVPQWKQDQDVFWKSGERTSKGPVGMCLSLGSSTLSPEYSILLVAGIRS
jgi:hypothetical protein